MSKELWLSQSFRMGYGGLEHNLRITKGKSVRQNGLKERRHFNENLIVDGDLNNPDYVHDLIYKAVERRIGEQLYKINEKHIRQRHPKRVRTIDDWIESQCYERQGKQKKIVHEYIVQIGNKFTGCPFVYQVDADGNMIDKQGKIVPEWDTRKNLAYKDNKIVESKRCKLLKKIYREFVNEFKKANPQAEIISASIHADEYGGVHLHLNAIWFAKKKNDVGYGLSYTSAMQQQLDAKGIKYKNTRKENAMTVWKAEMKLLLKKVASNHNVFKLKMNNTEEHEPTEEFKISNDKRCEVFEEKDKELKAKENELKELESKLKSLQNELEDKEQELSKDIAKQEWYLLKKRYPEWYSEIHSIHLKNKNNNRKNVKNKNNSLYKGDSL